MEDGGSQVRLCLVSANGRTRRGELVLMLVIEGRERSSTSRSTSTITMKSGNRLAWAEVVDLGEANAGAAVEAGNDRGVIAGLKIDHDR